MNTSLASALGLDFLLIPGIVLPLAVVLAPTPYLAVVPAVYMALTIVVDESLGGKRSLPSLAGLRLGDFWLHLFGVNLLCFLLVAFATIDPGGSLPVLIVGPAPAALSALPPWQVAVLVFTMGLLLAVNYNVAHDLIHRIADNWRWFYGHLLMMLSFDSQLTISHVYGHHTNVGTADDPATARRGEDLYRFFIRSTFGQYREAWHFEASRLHRAGRGAASVRNRVLMGALGSLLFCAMVGFGFGIRSLACYLAACVIAKFFFETANYIQHYGLVRVPNSRVEARHSWDCPSVATRAFMFNQNNHSNHHLKPGRRCWELLPETRSVRMPYGYITMIILASAPPLWFRLIDPLVDRWSRENASGGEAEYAKAFGRAAAKRSPAL